MTSGELLYLTLVIAVFVGFASVLAYHSAKPGRVARRAAVQLAVPGPDMAMHAG
jgi:hypothetical protein